MLFQEQYKDVVDELDNEKLFFFGTTLQPLEGGEKLLKLTGVKMPNGNVRTRVVYNYPLHPGITVEIPFNEELDPIKFEMFLNDLAKMIAIEHPGNKLVDLPLDHLGMPDISMLSQEQAWILDLIFVAASGEFESTRAGFSVVKDYVQDIRDGSLQPDKLHDILLQAIKGNGGTPE